MFRWLDRFAATVLLAGSLLAQQPPAVFKDTVTQVHLTATVKNSKGELVGSLQESNFKVFDNGVEQEIRVFERQSALPLSISLLIDVSGSTAKDLKYETDSASKFLHALLTEGSNPQDAVALYTFDSDIQELRAFTHNYGSLDSALRFVHGSGGTSLYDAIFYAARDLEQRPGRKVIVVISDGGNTTSSRGSEESLRAAQLADAVIYPVVVLPITNIAGRNTGGEHFLIFVAQGTGGRTFFPDSGKLDQAFADIIAELRTQYFLAFYPQGVPLPKNPFHKLEVQVDRPDLRVSARSGYYGEAEGVTGPANAPAADNPTVVRKKK
jgi:Ca-activated chloride channel family protein